MDVLEAVAGVHASRCQVDTADTKLEILGIDFLPTLGIDNLPYDSDEALGSDDPDDPRPSEVCEAAIDGFGLAVNETRRAYKDAQELVRQYRSLPAGTRFPDDFCELVAGDPLEGFPQESCTGVTPEETINRFIDYYHTKAGALGQARAAIVANSPVPSIARYLSDRRRLLRGERPGLRAPPSPLPAPPEHHQRLGQLHGLPARRHSRLRPGRLLPRCPTARGVPGDLVLLYPDRMTRAAGSVQASQPPRRALACAAAASAALGLTGMGGVLGIFACRERAARPGPARAASMAPRLAFAVGQRQPYRVELRTELAITGDEHPVRFELQGVLQVEAHSQEDPVGLVLLLEQAKLTALGQPEADTSRARATLERPVLASFEAGRLKELRAAPDPDPLAAGLIRTLAAALQLAAPASAGESWTGVEQDAAGVYDVEYRGEGPGRYQTRKRRYHAAARPAGGALPIGVDLTPQIVSSRGVLELEAGGLRRRDSRDELRALLGAAADARSTTELRLERAGPPAPVRELARWEELKAILVPLGEPAARVGHRLDFDAARMAGTSFARTLQELEALASGPSGTTPLTEEQKGEALRQEGRLVSALAAFLRQDDARVAVLAERVRGRSVATRRLLEALGAAGSPRAQEALASLALDRKQAVSTRELAAHSLVRSPRPTEASVRALEAMLTDERLRQYGLLGLGTYCRELRAGGNPAAADAIARHLGEVLAAATSRTERVLALRAVENSGHEALLERVRPLLTDADPTLRGAAVEALRLMRAVEIDSLIASSLGDARSAMATVSASSGRPRAVSSRSGSEPCRGTPKKRNPRTCLVTQKPSACLRLLVAWPALDASS
ncbi:MAG: hypothetical protein JW751_07245 [Polyangiaceae bacterium]|nr:hypothetical protein [Polyangiaceae bacterium]